MNTNNKKLAIIGCTGSIGVQALEVAQKQNIKITALATNKDVKTVESQIRKFKPKLVALMDENAAKELKLKISDLDVKVVSGLDGVCEVASFKENDMVLNSIMGMAGLIPTLEALKAKKDIALANKETLVAGGALVIKTAHDYNAKIIPVDSEHSAIFQCLHSSSNIKRELKRIILTGSGGPFFGKTRDELKNVTRDEALKHPNWNMGEKITIDSATLMNKGFEFIEAIWLFKLKPEQISVIIHRESVIHSMVEYIDNSVIAQLGTPDMRLPIQYAVTYPERFKCPSTELDLLKYGKLTFFEPDEKTFKALKICKDAITKGGTLPAVVNGANEEAVKLFLERKISFLDISDLTEEAYNKHKNVLKPKLEDILSADYWAREIVRDAVKNN